MRKSLLSAFLVLLFFYGFLGYGYWLFSNELIQSSARAIGIHEPVTALNALDVSLQVLKHQAKNYPLIIVSLVIGFILVPILVFLYFKFRSPPKNQVVEGIYYSIGDIPVPKWRLDVKPAKLEFEDEELDKRFKKLPDTYQELIQEIAYILSQNKDAYVGDGHGNTLLEHSLEVFENALMNDENDDPLLPVIALSHDLGKILSHEKIDGVWVRKGYHDKLSGLILSELPSFKKLSFEEQSLLLIAVKYSHSKNEMPIFPSNTLQDRLQKLFFDAKRIDKEQTKKEKEHIEKKVSLDEIFEKDFHRIISQIQFQQYGLEKGVKAGGWRSGDSIFVLEVQVRRAIVSLVPADIVAAKGGVNRSKGSIPKISQEFVDFCRKKGWLVDEYRGMKARNGLWNIQPGKIIFKGAFWIKLPESLHFLLPENVPYEVEVLTPTQGDLNKKKVATKRRKPSVKINLKEAIEKEKDKKEGETQSSHGQISDKAVAENDLKDKEDRNNDLTEEEKKRKKLRAVSAALGVPL